MRTDTPETDAAWEKYTTPPYPLCSQDLADHARKLERQRNIAIAEIERILNTYGHKSDAGCNCDDCEHIRPIELALDEIKSLENVKSAATGSERKEHE